MQNETKVIFANRTPLHYSKTSCTKDETKYFESAAHAIKKGCVIFSYTFPDTSFVATFSSSLLTYSAVFPAIMNAVQTKKQFTEIQFDATHHADKTATTPLKNRTKTKNISKASGLISTSFYTILQHHP